MLLIPRTFFVKVICEERKARRPLHWKVNLFQADRDRASVRFISVFRVQSSPRLAGFLPKEAHQK